MDIEYVYTIIEKLFIEPSQGSRDWRLTRFRWGYVAGGRLEPCSQYSRTAASHCGMHTSDMTLTPAMVTGVTRHGFRPGETCASLMLVVDFGPKKWYMFKLKPLI